MKTLSILVAALALSFAGTANHNDDSMELGNFSVSLAVKDLAASRAFYAKLGFEIAGGEAAQNWQIMRKGDVTVGLFQGMFEKNIMTFNPGWNAQAETLDEFDDVREIQHWLVERGVGFKVKADESTTGPASFILEDPDGNTLLFDQHVN